MVNEEDRAIAARIQEKLSWCVRVNPAEDPKDATFEFPFTGDEAALIARSVRVFVSQTQPARRTPVCEECRTNFLGSFVPCAAHLPGVQGNPYAARRRGEGS